MLRTFRNKGAALTEYAFLSGLIGVVALGSVARFGETFGLLFQDAAQEIDALAVDVGGSDPSGGGAAGEGEGSSCEQPPNLYGLEVDAQFNGGPDVLRTTAYVVDLNENGAIELGELHAVFGNQFELWRDDGSIPGQSLWALVNPLYWGGGYEGTPDQIQPTTTHYDQPDDPDLAGWKEYGSVAGQMLNPASVSVIPSPLSSGFFIPPCP